MAPAPLPPLETPRSNEDTPRSLEPESLRRLRVPFRSTEVDRICKTERSWRATPRDLPPIRRPNPPLLCTQRPVNLQRSELENTASQVCIDRSKREKSKEHNETSPIRRVAPLKREETPTRTGAPLKVQTGRPPSRSPRPASYDGRFTQESQTTARRDRSLSHDLPRPKRLSKNSSNVEEMRSNKMDPPRRTSNLAVDLKGKKKHRLLPQLSMTEDIGKLSNALLTTHIEPVPKSRKDGYIPRSYDLVSVGKDPPYTISNAATRAFYGKRHLREAEAPLNLQVADELQGRDSLQYSTVWSDSAPGGDRPVSIASAFGLPSRVTSLSTGSGWEAEGLETDRYRRKHKSMEERRSQGERKTVERRQTEAVWHTQAVWPPQRVASSIRPAQSPFLIRYPSSSEASFGEFVASVTEIF